MKITKVVPKETEHTTLIASKHYLLATLPDLAHEGETQKESLERDFLSGLECYIKKFDPGEIIIFHYSAYLKRKISLLQEFFGEIPIYPNDYLSFSANSSREDSGSFFTPDDVFLNPFIDDFHKVSLPDRQKKVVVLITDDFIIGKEVFGKATLAFPKDETVQNFKIFFDMRNVTLLKHGYGTILSLDFPKQEFIYEDMMSDVHL